MEKTNKQKKLIIIHLLIFLIMTIVILVFFFVYLLPNIKEIQTIKNDTYTIFNTLSKVRKSGIDFDEFVKLTDNSVIDSVFSSEDSLYLKEIVNSVDENFYRYHLENNTNLDYIAFLDEKFSEFGEGELVDNKSILISKVLPTYSELVSDLGNGTLSELKFINYIESIMETFSLTFENQVGFSEIELLEGYSVGILDDSLETNVYYIPLTFDITGKRADILDFLYFAGHVGKIDINTDTNDLYIDANLDSDFRTTFRNKILKGQNNILSEGIFNNQILDVESLSFAEYIDPETNTSRVYEENSLANYIKTSTFSKDGDFKATIKLRFYVKGLPIYRIENYISGFISEFSKTFGQINNILGNGNLNSTDKQKLTDISTTMAQFQKSVLPNIQKSLATKNTINEGYNLVNNYYSTLNSYKTTLEQIVSNME